jgi:hypothetical protein
LFLVKKFLDFSIFRLLKNNFVAFDNLPLKWLSADREVALEVGYQDQVVLEAVEEGEEEVQQVLEDEVDSEEVESLYLTVPDWQSNKKSLYHVGLVFRVLVKTITGKQAKNRILRALLRTRSWKARTNPATTKVWSQHQLYALMQLSCKVLLQILHRKQREGN